MRVDIKNIASWLVNKYGLILFLNWLIKKLSKSETVVGFRRLIPDACLLLKWNP